MFDGAPVLVVAAAAIGLRCDAPRSEPARDPLGVGHGQAVDDPSTGQFLDHGGEPHQPLGLRRFVERVEPKAAASQRPTHGGEVRPELSGHVGYHPVVGGGGAAQHRHPGREQVEHADQPPVVGPEVVAPVGDAVGLVDDEQSAALADHRQHLAAELLVRQPLRRDQQHVHLVHLELLFDVAPLLTVGAVDGEGTDAEPLSRLDLVTHEGEQRRDQQRRAESPVSQQPGGDEVDGALAPAGPLHEQHPTPLAGQRQDRIQLVGPEPGRWVARQPPQQRECFIREIAWVAHAARTVGTPSDIDAALGLALQPVTRKRSQKRAVSVNSGSHSTRSHLLCPARPCRRLPQQRLPLGRGPASRAGQPAGQGQTVKERRRSGPNR